ncbi:MAG TPA: hypothetical protein VLX89_10225 [Actinomycetota bacterium]|nr:hypothetical protein [Actinomycetota bacterium]
MPAPRTCRSCGATLSPDLRWCGRCYTPIYELSPRARLHDGDFISAPLAEGGHRPHWSRWEKSATTLGPAGKIVASVLVVATLPLALALGMFLYAVLFPVVAAIALGSIWARGWIVPDEPELPPLPVIEVPVAEEPRSRSRVVLRALGWAVAIGASLTVAYGPVPAKAVVLASASIAGPIWFYRRVLDR